MNPAIDSSRERLFSQQPSCQIFQSGSGFSQGTGRESGRTRSRRAGPASLAEAMTAHEHEGRRPVQFERAVATVAHWMRRPASDRRTNSAVANGNPPA